MSTNNGLGIVHLEELLKSLPEVEQRRFARLYKLSVSVGRLRPPPTMHPWIQRQFGSVTATEAQKIIKVTNTVTLEGAIFNALRANRPIEFKDNIALEQDPRQDPLSTPLEQTPADVFGRVRGNHCITASNIAKYDTFHGLVIFDDFNPLAFSRERVVDYISTAQAWAEKAQETDLQAKYFFFMWNCLWRAGSTLLHGHAQMSLCRDMHYAKIEHLRRSALAYRAETGRDYFDDLYGVHEALGLGFQMGEVRAMAYLTPVKEKEIILMAPRLDDEIKERVYDALSCLRDRLGVVSFNLAIYLPPIARVSEDWSGFPVMVRMVDRGNHDSRASDFGAMEVYAQSVISSDPFLVSATLKDSVQTLV